MASTAAGGVHRHAVAATVVGEEVESRRRHLVVGEEVRPAAVGHDDLERVAGQRRAAHEVPRPPRIPIRPAPVVEAPRLLRSH